MRVTGSDFFVLEVPDSAVVPPTGDGQPIIDLGRLPSGEAAQALAVAEAAQASADDAQAAADGAAADATVAVAATAGLPSSQVTWVRTPADLPAAVAGVRTLVDNHLYYFVANVDVGTDVVVSSDRVALLGIGATQSSLRTANASPLLTGRRVVLRDIALTNSLGPVARVVGAVPADIGGILRADGCGFVGASASGVVQVQDLDLVAMQTCRWQGCAGVGLRTAGTCRTVFTGSCISQGNAAAFKMIEVPAGATISGRCIAANLAADLASGGVGVAVDPGALQPLGLTLSSCGFPAPSTPGVGSPVTGISADSPKAYFGGNVNLENTQLRGALDIASNATATTVTNTTDFFPLAGATTLQEGVGFDSPAAGALRWTGSGPLRVRVLAFVSLSTGSPNQDLQLALAVTPTSGPLVVLPFRQEDITDGTTLRTGNMAIMGWATLNPGDAVDLRVRNRTAANNVTWLHGQVLVEQVGN